VAAGSALEDDQLKEKLARAELAALTNQDLTVLDKELAVLRQEVASRKEAATGAEARLRSRDICAPIAGQALRYEFVIGELVRPESVLFEIFGGDRQILKLRISERYATRVAVGNRYRARLASYRGMTAPWFTGEIQQLRNVIQSEGQSTYRVAHCTFNARGRPVPPGTTAEAHVYYGKTCLWFYLFGMG